MTTDYYSGDFNYNNTNPSGFYQNPQQNYQNQNYMTPNYNNYPSNYQNTFTNQNYPSQPYMNQNFPQNYPQQPQYQPVQVGQTTNQTKKNLPLEIIGGRCIGSCQCAKKNGLQDRLCERILCKYENEVKRHKRNLWKTERPSTPAASPSMNPSGDANNYYENPAYNNYNYRMVPSDAQPVSYNYGM